VFVRYYVTSFSVQVLASVTAVTDAEALKDGPHNFSWLGSQSGIEILGIALLSFEVSLPSSL
jgi:hypothetical protein